MTRWLLRRLGRLLLSGIFVVAGADAFRDPGPRAGKAEALGIPYPELATQVNAATMVVAGAALALGLRTRWAAATLVGSLIPTTLAGHPYWKEEDPQARSLQRTQFLKNAGLLGGLLAVLAAEG
ncbi:MAG: DoxX family protein [Actinomycetota bacterium]|nr:DoxX family protein [Actinomycetota bacterium]